MFGDLPKLFGRDFAIAFFLPVVVALVIGLSLVLAFEKAPAQVAATDSSEARNQDRIESGIKAKEQELTADATIASLPSDPTTPPPEPAPFSLRLANASEQIKNHLVLGVSALGFTSWLAAVLLLALNDSLIRFKQGYGPFNPLRLLKPYQKNKWKRLESRVAELKEQYEVQGEAKMAAYINALREQGCDFPDEERWLLPTAFGNAVRAFEVYPRVLYGLDEVAGWSRIQLVMPIDQLALVDTKKAQMNFWLNCWVLSLVILGEYAWLAIRSREAGPWLVPAGIAAAAYFSSLSARDAAIRWGESVKSAFDVFVPELRKRMELQDVADRSSERKQWQRLSQAMLYRSAKALPERETASEQTRGRK